VFDALIEHYGLIAVLLIHFMAIQLKGFDR